MKEISSLRWIAIRVIRRGLVCCFYKIKDYCLHKSKKVIVVSKAIEARIAGAGSTEDVPACFSFGIVFFINAAIWRKTTMEFFNQAITVLQTLVVAIGAGLGVWGVVNLMEGYGNDNPGAKSQGMKQLMSGGGVILIGT